MARFDLNKLRDIADEGIARHGLRGYARKLGLDVSTMRSLRDGRDMQISKVMEIVAALGLSLELRPDAAASAPGNPAARADGPQADDDRIGIAFHDSAPQSGAAPVAFHADWLAAQGWNAAHLRCVIAPDEGSAGCVAPGALCLLDCTLGWPGAHAIWAYLDRRALHISYLSRPDPGVLLVAGCDPSIPARQITGPSLDAITPLGRVVWVGGLLAERG